MNQRRLIIDDLALILRKPRAAPMVEPSEVIAIALSMVRWTPGRLHGPDDRIVQLILRGLREAGWKIEPI